MEPVNALPSFEADGYELVSIEPDDTAVSRYLPLPTEAERLQARAGDLVKLIFRYRDPTPARNGVVLESERMWVKITNANEGFLTGRLDSSPRFTGLLRRDATINFQPKHILEFSRPG